VIPAVPVFQCGFEFEILVRDVVEAPTLLGCEPAAVAVLLTHVMVPFCHAIEVILQLVAWPAALHLS